MADISDVEAAVREAVQVVRTAQFPDVPVYRGWPAPEALKAAAGGGKAIITITPRPGFNRLTTRYPNEDYVQATLASTLTVTTTGNTAIFAGTCGPDHLAGVQVGTYAWAIRCEAGDKPATVAAKLAALSGGTASGPVLTVQGLTAARTGRDAATLRPTRQQEIGIMVALWCATPGQRDQIGAVLDAALSDITFLTLPDGSAARFKWAGGMVSDKAENADLYRRDLYFTVEFSTTVSGHAATVLFPGGVIHTPKAVPFGAAPPWAPMPTARPTGSTTS